MSTYTEKEFLKAFVKLDFCSMLNYFGKVAEK
jgi:hypothetical protein